LVVDNVTEFGRMANELGYGLPAEEGGPEYVNYTGSGIIDITGTGTYILLTVAHPNRLGTVRLWSPDRATLWAETSNYASVLITRRFTGNSLLEAYFWKDSDEEYYLLEGGWMEDDEGYWYQIRYRRANKDKVQIIAYGPHKMLDKRITVPEAGQYGISATGVPDAVIKAIVAGAVRGLPITTATARETGTTISEISRYKVLGEEVRRICEANGLGEAFAKTDTGFEFDTYEGTDRTAGNTADNPPAIFSIRYDNLEDWAHSISSADRVTTVYVAGQGTGEARTLLIIGDAETGEDRYELFRDARDTDDTDVLTTRGNEALSPIAEALTAKANTASNLTYNVDYQLGDLVTVEIPERGVELVGEVWTKYDRYRAENKRITEIIRTYEGGSLDIDLVFGDAPKTRADKQSQIQKSLSRLEGI